jgi:hypothetical protein
MQAGQRAKVPPSARMWPTAGIAPGLARSPYRVAVGQSIDGHRQPQGEHQPADGMPWPEAGQHRPDRRHADHRRDVEQLVAADRQLGAARLMTNLPGSRVGGVNALLRAASPPP